MDACQELDVFCRQSLWPTNAGNNAGSWLYGGGSVGNLPGNWGIPVRRPRVFILASCIKPIYHPMAASGIEERWLAATADANPIDLGLYLALSPSEDGLGQSSLEGFCFAS